MNERVLGAADLEHGGEGADRVPRRATRAHFKDGGAERPHVRLHPASSEVLNLWGVGVGVGMGFDWGLRGWSRGMNGRCG